MHIWQNFTVKLHCKKKSLQKINSTISIKDISFNHKTQFQNKTPMKNQYEKLLILT